jgi:hypothetical protein
MTTRPELTPAEQQARKLAAAGDMLTIGDWADVLRREFGNAVERAAGQILDTYPAIETAIVSAWAARVHDTLTALHTELVASASPGIGSPAFDRRREDRGGPGGTERRLLSAGILRSAHPEVTRGDGLPPASLRPGCAVRRVSEAPEQFVLGVLEPVHAARTEIKSLIDDAATALDLEPLREKTEAAFLALSAEILRHATEARRLRDGIEEVGSYCLQQQGEKDKESRGSPVSSGLEDRVAAGQAGVYSEVEDMLAELLEED